MRTGAAFADLARFDEADATLRHGLETAATLLATHGRAAALPRGGCHRHRLIGTDERFTEILGFVLRRPRFTFRPSPTLAIPQPLGTAGPNRPVGRNDDWREGHEQRSPDSSTAGCRGLRRGTSCPRPPRARSCHPFGTACPSLLAVPTKPRSGTGWAGSSNPIPPKRGWNSKPARPSNSPKTTKPRDNLPRPPSPSRRTRPRSRSR